MKQRSPNKSRPILWAIIAISIAIAACNLSLPTPPSAPETPTRIPAETSPPPTNTPIPTSLETPSPTDETVLTRIEPEVSLSIIRFPDGSEIYLHPDTEIEIPRLAGSTADASGHEIFIRSGQILVISQLPAGEWFTIISSNGQIGRVRGSIILVNFDAVIGQFTAVCIEGICEIGADLQHLLGLAARDRGWFDADGNFQGPFDVNIDDLRRLYGTVIPAAPQIPPDVFTQTPSPTPDFAASATAACEEFQVEFPGTPCP